MRVVAENGIAHITAENVNENYPVAHLTNGDPSMPMLLAHGVSSTNITVDLMAGADCLGLIKTNISSITVQQLYAGSAVNEDDVTMESGTSYEVPSSLPVTITTTSDTHNGNYLLTWEPLDTAITLQLTVCSCGETLSVGEIAGGTSVQTCNPAYGLREGRVDLSPPVTLADNIPWFPAVDIGRRRRWSGTVTVARDRVFYNLMDVIDKYGSRPKLWDLADGMGGRWIAYCTVDMPDGEHANIIHSTINFNWTEL